MIKKKKNSWTNTWIKICWNDNLAGKWTYVIVQNTNGHCVTPCHAWTSRGKTKKETKKPRNGIMGIREGSLIRVG